MPESTFNPLQVELDRLRKELADYQGKADRADIEASMYKAMVKSREKDIKKVEEAIAKGVK